MSNFNRKPLTEENTWKRLKDLHQKSNLVMKDLFLADNKRFEKFSHRLATPDGEILFDFSKNIINEEILNALLDLVITNYFFSTQIFLFILYLISKHKGAR
jgi:glucose-6-phosphate isomerase